MLGKFIVFEGPDHCGKTTQIELLKELTKDKEYIFTREPGGTGLAVCEEIRKIILNPDLEINPITEAYLYAASRAEHVKWIRSQLEKGQTVICDRYYYSSLVYQGIGRGLGMDTIQSLNDIALDDLYPDLIFYLEVDMDTYVKRKINQKELDRLEREKEAFFAKVIASYEYLFKTALRGTVEIVTLDGSKDIQTIHQEIKKHMI